MGSLKYVYVKRPGHDGDETYIVEVDGQRPIDVGDRLYARVPVGDFHLFDRATERGRLSPLAPGEHRGGADREDGGRGDGDVVSTESRIEPVEVRCA